MANVYLGILLDQVNSGTAAARYILNIRKSITCNEIPLDAATDILFLIKMQKRGNPPEWIRLLQI